MFALQVPSNLVAKRLKMTGGQYGKDHIIHLFTNSVKIFSWKKIRVAEKKKYKLCSYILFSSLDEFWAKVVSVAKVQWQTIGGGAAGGRTLQSCSNHCSPLLLPMHPNETGLSAPELVCKLIGDVKTDIVTHLCIQLLQLKLQLMLLVATNKQSPALMFVDGEFPCMCRWYLFEKNTHVYLLNVCVTFFFFLRPSSLSPVSVRFKAENERHSSAD